MSSLFFPFLLAVTAWSLLFLTVRISEGFCVIVAECVSAAALERLASIVCKNELRCRFRGNNCH